MGVAAVVDIFAGLVLVTFLIKGALRGLSGEVISLVATVGGFILAWKVSFPFSTFILKYFDLDPSITRIVALVVIYALCLLLGAYMQRGIKAFLRLTNLSSVDRFLGAAAGAAKTFILVLLVYTGIMALSPLVPTWWIKDSVAMSSVEIAWPYIQDFLEKAHMGKIDLSPFHDPEGAQKPDKSIQL